MPAVQTSYTQTLRPAVAGMKADMTPEVTISRIVENTAGIGFGVPVVKGTGDRQVKPAAGNTGAFRGITMLDQTVTHLAPTTTPDLYDDKDICAVMQKGTIWVLASVAVTAGDPVYFVPASGVWTNVSTANTLVPNAEFESSAGIGALAIIKLK